MGNQPITRVTPIDDRQMPAILPNKQTELIALNDLLARANSTLYSDDLAQALKSADEQEIKSLRTNLQKLQQSQVATTPFFTSECATNWQRNLYSHMVAFCALVNETLAKLKTTNHAQKRDDKYEAEKKQLDKEYYAWFQCVLEMLAGFIAGCISVTSEMGRVLAEFGVGKVSSGLGSVFHNKSSELEHGVHILDKKQDSARDRNQMIGRLNLDILDKVSRAMSMHGDFIRSAKINN